MACAGRLGVAGAVLAKPGMSRRVEGAPTSSASGGLLGGHQGARTPLPKVREGAVYRLAGERVNAGRGLRREFLERGHGALVRWRRGRIQPA